MSNHVIEALERAIAVSESIEDARVAQDHLIAACKRIVRSSRQVQPCPSCGIRFQGAHYCVGRKVNPGDVIPYSNRVFYTHEHNCSCILCSSQHFDYLHSVKLGD